MLAYKPSTVREQKIINSLNKPAKPQINYNSEWHITGEDLILMFVSSTLFALLIVFLV
jgi:hypothetical protein